jgi:hypothetical protein
MTDHHISILVLVILFVAICVCMMSFRETSGLKNDTNGTIPQSQDHAMPDINITDQLFDEMVDIVTNYSLMRKNNTEKLLLIYLSTFHLFDMNYDYRMIQKLDEKLKEYPYISNSVNFPKGSMYHNLQKAIITHITYQIANSERNLVHDREKDRQIIHTYLSRLFQSLQIM